MRINFFINMVVSKASSQAPEQRHARAEAPWAACLQNLALSSRQYELAQHATPGSKRHALQASRLPAPRQWETTDFTRDSISDLG